MISFFGEQHFECLLILPLLSATSVKCDNCDALHGVSIIVGWLFWEGGIVFEWDEQ